MESSCSRFIKEKGWSNSMLQMEFDLEQDPAFWQEMAAFLLARHSRVELKAAMRQDKHKASEAKTIHRRVWHNIRECIEQGMPFLRLISAIVSGGWIRDQGFDWSDSLSTQIKRLFDEYRSSSMETAIVFIEDMELDELIG